MTSFHQLQAWLEEHRDVKVEIGDRKTTDDWTVTLVRNINESVEESVTGTSSKGLVEALEDAVTQTEHFGFG